jgi:hypothetical protein
MRRQWLCRVQCPRTLDYVADIRIYLLFLYNYLTLQLLLRTHPCELSSQAILQALLDQRWIALYAVLVEVQA